MANEDKKKQSTINNYALSTNNGNKEQKLLQWKTRELCFEMDEILEASYTPEILEAIEPPEFPLIRRIIGGFDNVIHSLVFEFVNGERRGLCLDERNEPLRVMDDSNITRRIGENWIDINYGDYIVAISGFDLNQNKFLCHSVTLQFKSGFEVTFESKKQAWRGDSFHYKVPPTKLVTNLVFLTNGTMPAIGVNTTSIHLPIRKEYVSLLPDQHRGRIIKLFMTFNRFLLEDDDIKKSFNLLPYEVGWKIISYVCGYDLHES